MTRALALGLAAAAAASAALAEGGPIRSGEHETFSRLVMEIEPATEWSLERDGRVVTILFPRTEIAFGTGAVFDLIPRTRIQAVETGITPEGTSVSVTLGCDCRVSTVFVGARWLALDIGDRVAAATPSAPVVSVPPAPAPPAPPVTDGPPKSGHKGLAAALEEAAEALAAAEAQEARERVAVSSAEEILLRQIERAANQGLIELAEAGQAAEAGSPVVVTAPAPLPRPVATPSPVVPLALARGGLQAPPSLTDLLDQDQVRALTVFDRDRPVTNERAVAPAVQIECRPDDDFAIGRWADSRPAHMQIAARSVHLLGEFDTPDPRVLGEIARIQIRFGLGAEAEQLLGAFPVPLAERALLVDLARAVESRPPRPGGPLSVGAACPGAHGLWLAIAGTGPAWRDAGHFAGIAAAFGELPPDLRALVGPGLIERLIDEDRADAARLIYDTMSRPEPARSAALRLAEARLVATEGSGEAAMRALGDLVEDGSHNAPDALRHLARIALDIGAPLPDRLVADLGAQTRLFDAGPRGPEYRALLIEAMAARGEIVPAIAELRAAGTRWPSDGRFPALAVALLAGADPALTGPSAYAETVLTSRDLLPDDPDTDAVRRAIARRLLDLDLASPAREIIAPALVRDDADARLLDAEAALALGQTVAAQEVLAGLEGDSAAMLRARAFARDAEFDAAQAALIEAGLEAEAEALAWSSGDWVRAAAAAAEGEDEARLAMARYMEARADPALAPPPAPDPAALTGAEAFVDPLPSLDRPNLAAARRLLATGRELEDFVAELLQSQ